MSRRYGNRLALLGLAAAAVVMAGCGAGATMMNGTVTPISPAPALRSAIHRDVTSFTLPADTNADYAISPVELTSYATAFLKGNPWPRGPSPISPLAVSTAASIFLQSGSYHYDASQTPPYQIGAPGGQTVSVS